MRRNAYIWNLARDEAGRRAKRDQLVGIGCDSVLVKGFGDDGTAWIPGEVLPDFAAPQWDDAWLGGLGGLVPYLWGYNWPRDSDVASCLRALRHRWSDIVVLNPETEWRWQNSQANPWNSLAEANAAAERWMQQLIAGCRSSFGRVPSFLISGCPTWADFPYEGFMRWCDGSLPEHYFFEADFANGEDMVEAHIRRAGTDKPCWPTLTACGEYADQGVIDLAKLALRDYPNPAGFSVWEAGNSAFQVEAVRQAYLLLPDATPATPPLEHKTDVIDPGFPGIVQPDGTLVINGQVVPDGIAVQASALELTVRNAAGETQSIKWQGGAWEPWRVV